MAPALWQHLNRYIVIQSVTLDQTEKAMTLSDLGIKLFKHTEAQTSPLEDNLNRARHTHVQIQKLDFDTIFFLPG